MAAALAELEAAAVATGRFRSTGEPVAVSADGRTSVLTVGIPFDESDDRVDSAIRELRADLAPQPLDGLDVEYAVGGDAAESLDFVDRQQERLPLVIGFVLLLTLLIMAATFRSLPIAIVSAVLNLASVGVAFGMMALVFQHGWFESALDFTSPGFVIDWIPLFVLVVLVGLSMDYHVFVLSRVREHVQRGLPTRLAVRQGVAETAGVVTSAAAVMVSVFSIFATLSMLEMKMMGVGLSFAILLDATLDPAGHAPGDPLPARRPGVVADAAAPASSASAVIGARAGVRAGRSVTPGQGGQSASRSCSTSAAMLSTAAWSSPETSTVSPHFAPRVMIISEELASTPLIVTVLPSPPAASAMIAAGRACRPTDEPTTTDVLGMVLLGGLGQLWSSTWTSTCSGWRSSGRGIVVPGSPAAAEP